MGGQQAQGQGSPGDGRSVAATALAVIGAGVDRSRGRSRLVGAGWSGQVGQSRLVGAADRSDGIDSIDRALIREQVHGYSEQVDRSSFDRSMLMRAAFMGAS